MDEMKLSKQELAKYMQVFNSVFENYAKDSSIASRIISDTLEAGLIKSADIETAYKKYMTYIPYYG